MSFLTDVSKLCLNYKDHDMIFSTRYMMKEKDSFPPCFKDLGETLELYFQICSTLASCRAMADMAATLANGTHGGVSTHSLVVPTRSLDASTHTLSHWRTILASRSSTCSLTNTCQRC